MARPDERIQLLFIGRVSPLAPQSGALFGVNDFVPNSSATSQPELIGTACSRASSLSTTYLSIAKQRVGITASYQSERSPRDLASRNAPVRLRTLSLT